MLGNKPKALMCCICGCEYGSTSLEIHFKKCSKTNGRDIPEECSELFTRIQNKEKLTSEDYDLFNDFASEHYKANTLVPCPNCNRRFAPDRLDIHLKGCKTKINTISTNKTSKAPTVNGTQVKKASIIPTKFNDDKNSGNQLDEMKSNFKGGGGGGLSTQTGNQLSKSAQFGKSKPSFLVCYICGREFGKHSLEIHLEKCAEKKYNEDIKTMSKKEIKIPSIPDALTEILNKLKNSEEVSMDDISQYNAVAEELFKEYTMKKCPGCGRKFLPDRLEVHLKSCKSGGGGGDSYFKNVKVPNMMSKPRMHMCPLCGKEYGSLSLDIHLKTCKIKFDKEQQDVPKNKRRSAADILEKFKQANVALKASGEYDLDKLNVETFEIFNKEALVPCDICGRTFLPDRLVVHLRSCKKQQDKKEGKK